MRNAEILEISGDCGRIVQREVCVQLQPIGRDRNTSHGFTRAVLNRWNPYAVAPSAIAKGRGTASFSESRERKALIDAEHLFPGIAAQPLSPFLDVGNPEAGQLI